MELRPNAGAKRKREHVGRGISAGRGKTCGRGTKGQKARGQVKPGFSGGQLPLARRLPQLRGVSKKAHNIGIFRQEWAVVNLGRLEQMEFAGNLVTPELLVQRGVVKKLGAGLRVLGQGELTKPLRIQAHAFSASALEKIARAGGEAVKI
jgi:large subunit ribosomal protein L15